MLCACIDIGSNTTRLLIAALADGRLRPLVQRRVFTRIGVALRADGCVGEVKAAEVARVVAAQRREAGRAGVDALRVVATAAIRRASDREALCRAVEEAAGVVVDVLEPEEEARLAFLGATATLPAPPRGLVGVVDVGGGSSEIALGTAAAGVTWSASYEIGSGSLTQASRPADPPGEGCLARMRARAHAVLPPPGGVAHPATAIAVGGSATSLPSLAGSVLDDDTIPRALAVLCAAPAGAVAADRGLDAERVRLLPAGIVILEAASRALGCPLQVGAGGLREGVCLELAMHGDPPSGGTIAPRG